MQWRKGIAVLATVLAGGFASAAANADVVFLKFVGTAGDILGDSTDPQHPNEIVVLSYSLGVTADSSWTKGGGASIGKPVPGAFEYTSALNRSIPVILKHITLGKQATTATLTLRGDGQGSRPGFEYAKYTFAEAFFTNVAQGLAGQGRVESAVSFVYKSVKLELFAQGSPGAVSCVIWDVPSGDVANC